METTNQENTRKRQEVIRRRKREQRRQFIAVTVVCCVIFIISLQLVTTSADSVVTETLPSSVDEQIESEVDLDEIKADVIASTQMRRMALVEEATVETVEEETAEEAEEKEVLHGWMDYTSDDVDLLAKIMYAEEGVLYKMYEDTDPEDVEMVTKLCGSVVLHRLANEMGGATTIEEVLYNCSNGIEQYASQTKTKVEEGQDVPEIFFTWAEQLLQDGPLGPNNLVFQAEFKQGEVYAQYWNQIFCLSKYLPETEED